MNNKIRIGIVGYGNLGKGVELGIQNNPDMELTCIVTKRNPNEIKCNSSNISIVNINEIESLKGKVDVMILCSGSAFDLPEQGPKFAKLFNTVDSFDTHANIPNYYNNMNMSSTSANTVSIISVGWDPGLFSINRAFSKAIFPNGNTYTFWGKGVSQGHSNAIRNIPGVIDAVQYTIPIEQSLEQVRSGTNPQLTTRQKHLRECFVVVEDNVDKGKIEFEIKNMKNYFDEYETIVHFVDIDELHKNHSKMLHGGCVISSGNTGINNENKQIIEYKLQLDSNPEFTSSVLIAYARAAKRLYDKKDFGTKTVLDIPPSMLLGIDTTEIMKLI